VSQTPTTGAWHAIHVYYAADHRSLLADAIKPLIDRLRADGLLAGYFFINYWLEGPHVRLRLKPSTPEATEEVLDRARDAITAFLKVRPALYGNRWEFLRRLHNTIFEMEYTAEQRQQYLDSNGDMRLRENNTFSDEPYEPEYGKYGGRAGVALAEWHFERSSDLVTDLFKTMNVHLRNVLLGIASQLMMTMTAAFLDDRDPTVDFLQSYHDFWQKAFAETVFISTDRYDRAYARMDSTVLTRRFEVIRAAFAEGRTDDLPEFIRGWAAHCTELRRRVVDLATRGELEFSTWHGDGTEVVTEPGRALVRLLSPYLHMTNNRLQVTLADEAYLAHIMAKALRESASLRAAHQREIRSEPARATT
jgi:hypothetical protein